MTEKSSKNRIFAGILVLVMVLCSSCGAQNNAANAANNAADSGNSAQSNTSNSAQPGGQGSAAEKVADYAARNNNLVFEHEYDSVPITISGLKDEAVQQKINDVIAAEFARLNDPSYVPQARGIKLYEKQARKTPEVTVYAYVRANCDNILSVCMEYYRMYDLGSNRSARVYAPVALNFDLSTGEQISLKDLFPDGMDYMGYLNDRMVELIQTSDPSKETTDMDWLFYGTQKIPQLISEFKGLREDQPFYLTDKGKLVIILDFGNPEFYSESGAFSVNLDISDVYYAGRRFGGDRGLFTDNSSRYHLVYFDIPGGIVSNKSFTEIAGTDAQHFVGSLSTTQYAGLTEKQNSFLALEFMDVEGRVKEEAQALEEFRKTHNNYGDAFVSCNSNASRYGGFVNLISSFYSYIYAADREYGRVQENYLACYRYGTDEEVKLEELFREGSDWKAVLKEGMIRQTEKFLDGSTLDPHSKQYSDYLDDMIGRIIGFGVYYDRLELCFDGNSGAEYIKDFDQNSWYYIYSVSYIEFDSLGYENLAIFE